MLFRDVVLEDCSLLVLEDTSRTKFGGLGLGLELVWPWSRISMNFALLVQWRIQDFVKGRVDFWQWTHGCAATAHGCAGKGSGMTCSPPNGGSGA